MKRLLLQKFRRMFFTGRVSDVGLIVDEKILPTRNEVEQLLSRLAQLESLNTHQSERIAYLEEVAGTYGTQLRGIEAALSSNAAQLSDMVDLTASVPTGLSQIKFENEPLNSDAVSVNDSKGSTPLDGFDYELYRAEVIKNYTPHANSISVYERLLDYLDTSDELLIVPMSDLMSTNREEKKVVALRHDIDADPEMGVYMARMLARAGMPGAFYLLHSATYYGQYYQNQLIRNPMLKNWVKEFILTGCELGLHNDALGLTKSLGISGIDALNSELSYLRSNGADIRGTVAHNSYPTQSAENFEIFKEFVTWDRFQSYGKQQGNVLGVTSMSAHGLSYEGNYPLIKESVNSQELRAFLDLTPGPKNQYWMKAYLQENPYMNRAYDCDIWLIGRDQWCCCSRIKGHRQFIHSISFSEMLAFLDQLPTDTTSVITLHPEYFQFI